VDGSLVDTTDNAYLGCGTVLREVWVSLNEVMTCGAVCGMEGKCLLGDLSVCFGDVSA